MFYCKRLLCIVIPIIVLISTCMVPVYAAEPMSMYAKPRLLSVSEGHTLVVKNDGTVWSWGKNDFGQLGDSTNNERVSPIKVQDITDVVSVAAGENFSVALKNDGTVWSWGKNDLGQLGVGTYTDNWIPVKVNGLTGIVDIAAGISHVVALRYDGTVWCWGDNSYNQLGYEVVLPNNPQNSCIPVQVKGLFNIKDISAEHQGCSALKSDGYVWSWGYNYNYAADSLFALHEILGIGNISYISGTLAMDKNGDVWAWGKSVRKRVVGAASVPQDPYSIEPVMLSGINNIMEMDTDDYFKRTMFIKNDGSVWVCPASESNNALGTLRNIKEFNGAIAVAAGINHVAVLKKDGSIWTMGKNEHGQLGRGTASQMPKPVMVKGINGAVDAIAGNHQVVLKKDGTVWTWGNNAYGQLGNSGWGPKSYTNVPVQIKEIQNIKKVAKGDTYTAALAEDGNLWLWGSIYQGSGAKDAKYEVHYPVKVKGIRDVVEVVGGSYKPLLIKKDGSVWKISVKYNTKMKKSEIEAVKADEFQYVYNVVSVAQDKEHIVLVTKAGKVYVWNTPISKLRKAEALKDVKSVALTKEAIIVLLNNGTVMKCAFEVFAETELILHEKLGVPVKVPELSGITAVTAGRNHYIALSKDGTLWGWGRNSEGQLGVGAKLEDIKPAQVSGLKDVMKVSAHGSNTSVIRKDGTLWSWGDNTDGQLGYAESLEPAPIAGKLGPNVFDAYPKTVAQKTAESVYKTTYLSDLPCESVTSEVYMFQIDKSAEGKKMIMNKVPYIKGIGTNSNSEIVYNLEGKYEAFACSVGLDDGIGETGEGGTVMFQVYADDVLVYESGFMNRNSSTQHIYLDVSGKQKLRLSVSDNYDGTLNDYVNWANARLLYSWNTILPASISYSQSPGGVFIFSNNPESIFDRDVEVDDKGNPKYVLYKQKIGPGVVAVDMEHENRSSGNIYFGIYLYNDSSLNQGDVQITVTNKGAGDDGSKTGFTVGRGASAYDIKNLVGYNEPINESYTIPAGRRTWIMGTFDKPCMIKAPIKDFSDIMNARLQFYTNKPVEINLCVFKDPNLYLENNIDRFAGAAYSGYVTNEAHREFRVYKGLADGLPEVTGKMEWSIGDNTSPGVLPVCYKTFDSDAMRWSDNPVVFGGWTTNISSQKSPYAYVNDLITLKEPNGNVFGPTLKDPYKPSNEANLICNLANWCVLYKDNITIHNNGDKVRHAVVYLADGATGRNTKGGVINNSPVVINSNGDVIKKIYSPTNAEAVLSTRNSAETMKQLGDVIEIPANGTATCTVEFQLPSPTVGGLKHYVELID